MRRFLLVLWASLACMASCGGEVPPPPEPEVNPPEPEVPEVRELLAPGDLSVKRTAEGVVLTWKDLSTLEEGYLVEKQHASESKAASFFLPANTTSWTDPAFTSGVTRYRVASYWHLDRSEFASATFEEYAAPQVKLRSVEASYHMVACEVEVLSDGGAPVRCGVLRSREGEEPEELPFAGLLSSGKCGWVLSEDLQAGVSYQFTPFADYSGGRVYGEARAAERLPAPEPVVVAWELVTSAPELEIRKASTDVLGHPVNLWCAVADFTQGSLELRTTLAGSLTEPGVYIREQLAGEEVLVLVNGGYFASPASSYSYVCDRGVKKASNVSSLTRTDVYSVTRGFFGTDAEGVMVVGWQSGDGFYNAPLPVYDGGPVLSLPSGLPVVEGWQPYSAIGGGPVLLKGGAYCFDFLKSREGYYLSNHELFQADIFADGLRAPRTAVGTDGAGRVCLLVADGRGSGGSTGLTLDELARIMAGLGCTDVLNLDGGGSSAFLTGSEGTLRNHPSDGHERKVLSYVSIMRRR